MDEKFVRSQSVPTLIKKKASVMNEIQAWVNGNSKYLANPEVTRNSGQLAENVTEERMLKSKLMELSKERYKFLVKAAYEKKIFSDRQQKKPALRHLFLESNRVHSKTPRRALTSIPGNTRSVLNDNSDKSKLMPRSYTRVSWYKIDHDKQTHASSAVHAKSLQQPVHENISDNITCDADLALSQSEKRNTLKTSPDAPVIRHPIISSRTFGIAQSKTSVGACSDLPQRLTSGIASSSVNSFSSSRNKPSEKCGIRETTQSSSTTKSKLDTMPIWLRRGIKQNSKYGTRIQSSVTDPRYACLEQVLSPVLNQSRVDVETIVDQMESLHVRPKKKVNNSKRTKIEIKAMEYMKLKRYVF